MKKVLLVIDMQNDYLWNKRKKKFNYNSDELTANVNSIIEEFHNDGCDVVYVKHIIQNLWTNRLLFGFSIKGTQGAELYDDLKIVSDYCFEKLVPDTFGMRKFREFMREKDYDSVAIVGIDICGCVGATAEGAVRNGLNTEIISLGAASKSSAGKVMRKREQLEAMGVKFT